MRVPEHTAPHHQSCGSTKPEVARLYHWLLGSGPERALKRSEAYPRDRVSGRIQETVLCEFNTSQSSLSFLVVGGTSRKLGFISCSASFDKKGVEKETPLSHSQPSGRSFVDLDWAPLDSGELSILTALPASICFS